MSRSGKKKNIVVRGTRFLVNAAKRKIERAKKRSMQRKQFGASTESRPVFLVGCQRSGTNMFVDTIEKAPEVWLYNEFDRPAFDHDRLRPRPVIRRLIDRCYAPIILFKPICDSHRVDEILDEFPGSRAVWIYRDYRDVANSMIRFAGKEVDDVVRWVCLERENAPASPREYLYYPRKWISERLDEDVWRTVCDHYGEGRSPYEAAALLWYLRTSLVLTLNLFSRPDVLIVRYEDLVSDPESFANAFEFVGCPFRQEYVQDVFGSSVGRHKFPEIDPAIARLCEDLHAQLEDHRGRQCAISKAAAGV